MDGKEIRLVAHEIYEKLGQEALYKWADSNGFTYELCTKCETDSPVAKIGGAIECLTCGSTVRKLSFEERKKDYVENPNHCPFCGSNKIGRTDLEEGDDNTVIQGMFCHDCQKEWTDTYTLSYITED